MASFELEKSFFKGGFYYIAGVDEAGRGALFGPVVAAAVILPPEFYDHSCPEWVAEIDDSKSLSPKKREKLKKLIEQVALAVGVGAASVREIEKLNIQAATLLAMSRAVSRLAIVPDLLLIDGKFCHLKNLSIPQISLKRGDKLCKSIAAASIVAKVVRDELMINLDRICQGYKLCNNKGYGTKAHFEALRKMGPTPLHRQNFKLRV